MFHNLLLQGSEFFSETTITYLMLVNTTGLILMAWDKIMAKLGKKAFGGSMGTWIGMQIFKHKTRHALFVYGIPLIIILQVELYSLFTFSSDSRLPFFFEVKFCRSPEYK